MSVTREALVFIQQRGTVRTPEIARHVGKDERWVSASLHRYCGPAGILIACRITRPEGQAINEYRMCAGAKLPTHGGRQANPNARRLEELKARRMELAAEIEKIDSQIEALT